MISTLLLFCSLALHVAASAPDPPNNVEFQRISDRGVRLQFSASLSGAVDGYLAEFDAAPDFSTSNYLRQFVSSVHPVTINKWSASSVVCARIAAHSVSDGYGPYVTPSPSCIDLTASDSDADKGWLEPPRVFYLVGGVFGVVFTCFFIWKLRSCIKRRAMGPNYSHPTGSEQEADAKDTLELVSHENGNRHSTNGVGRVSSDDLRLEDGIDDEEEPIAPLTVGRSAQAGLFDSVWFQQQWQSIMRTHTVQADVIEHQYFDTDILERLVERSGYTLIASGQPQTGLLKLYFFCDYSENPREKTKKHVVLGEVVVNIATHHLTGQFKSETADTKTMKAFTKSFETAFTSIIQPPNAKVF